MAVITCNNSEPTTLPALACQFDIKRLAGVLLMSKGAVINHFTGIDADAQRVNLATEANWTTGMAAPAPDRLYLAPAAWNYTADKVVSNSVNSPITGQKNITSQNVAELNITVSGISPEEYREWEQHLYGNQVQIAFVTYDGLLYIYNIQDGVEFPFLGTNGALDISSAGMSPDTPIEADLIIPLKQLWLGSLSSEPVDISAITYFNTVIGAKIN